MGCSMADEFDYDPDEMPKPAKVTDTYNAEGWPLVFVRTHLYSLDVIVFDLNTTQYRTQKSTQSVEEAKNLFRLASMRYKGEITPGDLPGTVH
jgi:hypothetical protein